MQSFVYAWQNTGTFPSKWYIGRKVGDYDQIAASNTYQSSCNSLAREMKKRPANFSRILLKGFDDKVSHVKLEADMLQAIDAARNPLYYNQHNGDGKFVYRGGVPSKRKGRTFAPHSAEGKQRKSVQRLSCQACLSCLTQMAQY